MAAATGIAVIIGDLGANDYVFDPTGIDATTVNGTWSQDSNTITWQGDDPSSTKGDAGSTDITELRVRTGPTFPVSLAVICDITHDPVTLSEGDTIIYTSINITFTT